MPLVHLSDREHREYSQNQPELPLWQSLVWKTYQASLGRKTRLYGLKNASGTVEAAALVIIDTTALGLATWDIPRGPTGNREYFAELLSGIIDEAKKDRCLATYCSPLEEISNNSQFSILNFQFSHRHEHPEATLLLDLTKSDEELLKEMKEKGRYNIRLAERHGVKVEASSDIHTFYELLKRTGHRDQFGIKPKSHYEKFLQLPRSFLLLAFDADTQKTPLAGLIGVVWGATGIYYYGASDERFKAKMAPYLLQWHAIKLCRSKGAKRYDFLGVAPTDDASHPWAGVTRFKKQFGGEVVNYPQEQEIRLMPITKRFIDWKRKILG